MSDHWEFFPCQIDEHQASIFYNHGIREELKQSKIEQFLEIQVPLKFPDSAGIIQDTENDTLFVIEDRISDFIEQYNGLYVGRITMNGARHFLCYLDKPEREISVVMDYFRDKLGYDFHFRVAADPTKRQYWERLYPGKFEWQIIHNIKGLQKLKADGDDLVSERSIVHHFDFPEESNALDFEKWVLNFPAFTIVQKPYLENKIYKMEVSYEGAPKLAELNQITTSFMANVEEFLGDYTGWGCEVRKA